MTAMRSWEVLPAAPIRQSGAISAGFLAHGLRDYRDAARFVGELPYGRNSARTATCEVLTEGHGTCSTKHALLALLAAEQQIPVALMLGIYEMNAVNTPGVDATLARHGIDCLPEAHCYVSHQGLRVDVTRTAIGSGQTGLSFLHEEIITPPQVAAYKVEVHQRFMLEWLSHSPLAARFTFQQLWSIREECITALSR